MDWIRMVRVAFFAAVFCVVAVSARAATEALLVLDAGGDGDFSRSLTAQSLLQDRYGFDQVDILTDATREEIYTRVQDFLERPGRRGDRRLVWISGTTMGKGALLCPGRRDQPLTPEVMTVILAPGCMTRMVAMPASGVHVSRTLYRPQKLTRMMLQNREAAYGGRHPGLAVLTLPSGQMTNVVQADEAILRALMKGRTDLKPMGLLAALKRQFRGKTTAGGYRPSLDIDAWHARFVQISNAARPAHGSTRRVWP